MLINDAMIYVENRTVKNPRGVVVITHGIALHTMYYYRISDALNEAGYQVYLYDVRGHGKSQGKRGDIKHINLFIEDLHQLILKIKDTTSLPIFLLGHSMGGVITNLYATTYDNYDGSIILSAPSQSSQLGILNILPYSLLSWVKIKTDFKDSRLSHIPFSNDVDPYALNHFSLRLTGNLMIRGIRTVNKQIKNYLKPVLLLHGGSDSLVPSSMSEALYQMIPAEDKTIKIYPEGYHNLNDDIVTDEVNQDIIEWLNNRTVSNEK